MVSVPSYLYAIIMQTFQVDNERRGLEKIIQKMWHSTNILAQVIAVFLRNAVAEEFHK